jgi:hypothetical protein
MLAIIGEALPAISELQISNSVVLGKRGAVDRGGLGNVLHQNLAQGLLPEKLVQCASLAIGNIDPRRSHL